MEEQPQIEPEKKKLSLGTPTKVILALLVGLGIGAIGVWYYLQPYIGAKVEDTATYKSGSKQETSQTSDPLAGWTKYSSKTGSFNFRYNPSWKTRICDNDDSTVYLGPTTESLAVCNSDSGALISISSVAGDKRSEYEQNMTYPDKASQAVTVSGVAGKRLTATVNETGALGPAAGTKLVQYIFFTGGRTYSCYYSQQPSGSFSQNVLSDFDTLVKSTFKFSS